MAIDQYEKIKLAKNIRVLQRQYQNDEMNLSILLEELESIDHFDSGEIIAGTFRELDKLTEYAIRFSNIQLLVETIKLSIDITESLIGIQDMFISIREWIKETRPRMHNTVRELSKLKEQYQRLKQQEEDNG